MTAAASNPCNRASGTSQGIEASSINPNIQQSNWSSWYTIAKVVGLGILIFSGAGLLYYLNGNHPEVEQTYSPINTGQRNEFSEPQPAHSSGIGIMPEFCPSDSFNRTDIVQAFGVNKISKHTYTYSIPYYCASDQSTLWSSVKSFFGGINIETAILEGNFLQVRKWAESQNFKLDDKALIHTVYLSIESGNAQIYCYFIQNFHQKLSPEAKALFLTELAKANDLVSIRTLLANQNFIEDRSYISPAIELSAREGRLQIFDYLEKFASQEDIEQAFFESLSNGHFNIVKHIMKKWDITSFSNFNSTLKFISQYGLVKSVRLLYVSGYLNDTNIVDCYQWASTYHRTATLEFLKENFDLSTLELHSSEQSFPEDESSLSPLPGEDAEYLTVKHFQCEKDWVRSVSSSDLQSAYDSVVDRLEKGLLSRPLFRYIRNNIEKFSEHQQFKIMEGLIYHRNTAQVQKFLESHIPNLSSEHQFILIRFYFLKNPHEAALFSLSDFSRLNLTAKQEEELRIIQHEMVKKDFSEKQEIQKILEAEANRSREKIPDQKEWQSHVETTIQPHLGRIKQLLGDNLGHKNLEKVHYYNSDAIIAEFEEMPGFIFKYFPNSWNAPSNRHRLTEEAIQLCQRKHLDRIRIPRSALLELDGISFLVEEKLQIIGHTFSEYRPRIELMNSHFETKRILDEALKQASIFIHDTRVCDLKPNNVPLLQDGTGIAFIDLDIHSAEGYRCLFRENYGHPPMAEFFDPSNFPALREGLVSADPEKFGKEDFYHLESLARTLSRQDQRLRNSMLKRGIINPTDPIVLDESTLAELTPAEQEFAKIILSKINAKLLSGDMEKGSDYPRPIFLSSGRDLYVWNEEFVAFYKKYPSPIPGEYEYKYLHRMYKEFKDLLIRKELISGIDESLGGMTGHGDVLLC